MSRTITARVIRSTTFEGRALVAGDIITVSPVAAAVLHHRGILSKAKIEPTPVIDLPAEDELERPKRRYRRRDLEPEGEP